jgi:peptide/nickel transport system substrate-binding protein
MTAPAGQSGEVDMLQIVAHDLLLLLERDKSVRIVPSRASNQYVFGMNWLQPPFDDPKVRRVAFTALRQEDFLDASVGDRRHWHSCKALFTRDSPLATQAGMDGLLEGGRCRSTIRRSSPTARNGMSSAPTSSRWSRRRP